MLPSFDHPYLVAFLMVANWPLYRAYGTIIFGDRHELGKAVYYWFVPDMVSALRGEWLEDQWATIKLTLFALICFAAIAAEYTGILKLVAWLFP